MKRSSICCLLVIIIFASCQTTRGLWNTKEKNVTRLMDAVSSEVSVDAIQRIIESEINIDERDSFNSTALMYAVQRQENPEIIERLIEAGADINARDNAGFTPLHHAVKGVNYNSLSVLLAAGADPDILDNGGKTPLIMSLEYAQMYFSYAMTAGYGTQLYLCVALMIENGVDVNFPSSNGNTPLAWAMQYEGQIPIEFENLLVEAGGHL